MELEVDRREKNSLLESMRAGIPFPGIEFLRALFLPGAGAGVFLSARRDA